MKNKKRSWFENDTFVRIFSIIIAIFCWITVAFIVNPTFTQTFHDIPVNVELRSEALAALELNVIDVSTETVSAIVKGERFAIGRLRPENLTATVQIPANITEPGDYSLRLVPVSSTGSTYDTINYIPSSVSVRLDRFENRAFTIEPVVNGLSLQPGYILDKGANVNPPQVTISGPRAEVDNIARCVVEAELTDPLEKTYADSFDIQLYDFQGNEIDLDKGHLTLDNTEAQLIVPVLKEAVLPLEIEFSHVPMGFPLNELSHHMSNKTIRVAGPVDSVDKYQQITLGYIDIRELSTNRSIYTFNVEMPSARFTNPENINSVTLTFNTDNWSEAYFNIGEASEIIVRNVPERYKVTLMTEKIYNVLFTGDKTILSGMTAEDIVAVLDLSDREITPGQYNYPIKISVPNKGLVWAVGEYSAVIQVAEKQQADE